MKTPVVHIALHRFTAVCLAVFGVCAESLLAVILFPYLGLLKKGLDAQFVAGLLVFAVGIVILVLLPFLYRTKEWARVAIVWLIAAGTVCIATAAVISVIESKHGFRDKLGTALMAVALVAIAVTTVLFLINRPFVDEFLDQETQSGRIEGAEPVASPNGGHAPLGGNTGRREGPPSVS